jgi:hypothetical protein
MKNKTEISEEENLFELSYRRNLQYETGTNGNIFIAWTQPGKETIVKTQWVKLEKLEE